MPRFMNYFNPSFIPGCALWVEADRGVTLDGSGRVSAWADQSGNARHLIQSTPANRELFVSNAMKGNPVFRGDSVTEVIDFVSTWADSTYSEFYAVCNKVGANTTTVLAFKSTGMLMVDSDGHPWLYSGGNTLCVWPSPVSGPAVIRGRWSNTANSNNCALSVNGAAETTYTFNVPVGLWQRLLGNANSNYDGDIAAFVIYNRWLSVVERDLIQRYFGLKYTITVA